jgi:hypothetical protein
MSTVKRTAAHPPLTEPRWHISSNPVAGDRNAGFDTTSGLLHRDEVQISAMRMMST